MDDRPAPASQPVSGPAPPLRLAYLDGIRALAALYVVLHHMWLTVWPELPENAGPLWTDWLLYGQVAVAVFIVVSGFSLAIGPVRSHQQLVGGPRRFIRRRAWRILPPYWAALVVSCLVIIVFTGVHSGDVVTAKGVAVHALLLQDVIGSATPNGAFWSIAIEWQIYFLFPLLLWVQRGRGTRSMVTLTSVVALAVYLASMDPTSPVHALQRLMPQFLILFVLGMAAARVLAPGRTRRSPVPLCALAGLGALGLVAYTAVFGSRAVVEHYFWVDLVAGACAALVIAGLAEGRARCLGEWLGRPVLRALGAFSFSMYLIHLPVIGVVFYGLVQPMDLGATGSFLVLVALGIPAVLAVSYGFSALFEKPFVRCRSLAELRGSARAWRRRAVGRAHPV
ncbi:MAG TPA: acyltransferase [Acidimicrobiia bacterium]|nr:acyltransferase [Acidimicrobiia bacterium]